MDSEKLRQAFQRDGFVFLPGFLSPGEVNEVNAQLEKLIREVVPTMPPEHAFYEDRADSSTLKQLQTLFSYDLFFHRMMFGSRFEQLATVLLDDTVTGQNMQYFNKPPRIGKPTPAHQDGFYFMLEPNEAMTMWMALEPVDEENGCVRYVRGSHLRGLRPHGRTGVLGFSQGMTDFGTPEDLENEVYFPTQAGDLLVHHSLTIHRADGNSSENRTRKALGFIYYADRAKEDVTRKRAYQAQLAAEQRAKTDPNA
ncbi:phytanoyl-CoA dioxygenase family protein [Larkinella terrae]|uniref:Phytanoyl-CoA dioxygenase family protein n=1 Tax=Larkinella terrae TaxID=2025311 RepID=A0A7K0ESJ4_9BACT|nr:phytanoyl-CoA dioxygenase family protein [Larkinella terrae]MRS64783.1 phytanoyl-CoA dioxygenase family protein [Larkinella terrae]